MARIRGHIAGWLLIVALLAAPAAGQISGGIPAPTLPEIDTATDRSLRLPATSPASPNS